LAQGFGAVYLPYTLEHKYPNAAKDWIWQHVFPAAKISTDPRTLRWCVVVMCRNKPYNWRLSKRCAMRT
jgi:hypothetical protein